MTDLDKKAIEILRNCDQKFYIDMIDPLEIGIAEAVKVFDDGVLIHARTDTWMWMSQNEKRGIEFAESLRNESSDCSFVVHDTNCLSASCEILHMRSGVPCYVAARFSSEKFNVKTDVEIKKLDHQYDNFVWKTYGLIKDWDGGLEYAKQSIDFGMLGAFKDGECIGFIGTHSEGTMGMLEILPEFRRRGYGEALEESLVNMYIDQGRIPYCHIFETNEASLSLQRDMGFWLSEGRRIVWLQDVE